VFQTAALLLLGAALGGEGADKAPDAQGWRTVWEDDFTGESLDRERWSPETSCWGGGNNERQCYTGREENILVEDGVLHLIARPERYTGPTYPSELAYLGQGTTERQYTSGKVRTKGLASWTYGRFSARMKLPEGQGTWPAFWMMPEDSAYGAWPLSGEIDIMEAVNLGTPCEDCERAVESRTSGALHFGDVVPSNTYLYLKAEEMAEGTPADGWHVYTVEWAEDRIQWLVDGELFLRIDAEDWFTASEEAEGRPFAPFDQPFYLMLNYAVGGNLAEKSNGGGFERGSFPSRLLVDWVRVEQCADDIETGKACLTKADWNGQPKGPWETQAR
jgi:beta-glucanase (GH16 family)